MNTPNNTLQTCLPLEFSGKSLITGGPFLLSIVQPTNLGFSLQKSPKLKTPRHLWQQSQELGIQAKEMRAAWFLALLRALYLRLKDPTVREFSSWRAWFYLAGCGTFAGALFFYQSLPAQP